MASWALAPGWRSQKTAALGAQLTGIQQMLHELGTLDDSGGGAVGAFESALLGLLVARGQRTIMCKQPHERAPRDGKWGRPKLRAH